MRRIVIYFFGNKGNVSDIDLGIKVVLEKREVMVLILILEVLVLSNLMKRI